MASNTLELRGVVFIFTLLSILHFGRSQEGCSQIADAYRFDCYPEDGASEQNCLNRGCCWRPPSAEVDGKVPLNIPYCFYPTNYGYKLVSKEKTQTGYLLRLVKQGHPGPYGKDIENLTVDVRFETRERLHFKVSWKKRVRTLVKVVYRLSVIFRFLFYLGSSLLSVDTNRNKR